MTICSEFESVLTADQIRTDIAMASYTTFRIGGNADVMLFPETEAEVVSCMEILKCRNLPYFVLGRGSNLLVSDSGYRGVVLNLRNVRSIEKTNAGIRAEAGALLSEAAKEALDAGLSGLEFASGIPGTVGGGIRMNAGAYGAEMKDVVESVRILTKDGMVKEYAASEMHFDYRHSLVCENHGIVLSADFRLIPEEKAKIIAQMETLNTMRRMKQPLDKPSAGSTFKRPAGHYAGKLIEEAGLKGFRIGDAAVSEKHAGFVVNLGHATASDVRAVIRHVRETVRREFGVDLEPEVLYLGE